MGTRTDWVFGKAGRGLTPTAGVCSIRFCSLRVMSFIRAHASCGTGLNSLVCSRVLGTNILPTKNDICFLFFARTVHYPSYAATTARSSRATTGGACARDAAAASRSARSRYASRTRSRSKRRARAPLQRRRTRPRCRQTRSRSKRRVRLAGRWPARVALTVLRGRIKESIYSETGRAYTRI